PDVGLTVEHLLGTNARADHRRPGPSKGPGEPHDVLLRHSADAGDSGRRPLADLASVSVQIARHLTGEREIRETFLQHDVRHPGRQYGVRAGLEGKMPVTGCGSAGPQRIKTDNRGAVRAASFLDEMPMVMAGGAIVRAPDQDEL